MTDAEITQMYKDHINEPGIVKRICEKANIKRARLYYLLWKNNISSGRGRPKTIKRENVNDGFFHHDNYYCY
jgi:hypothetical protein